MKERVNRKRGEKLIYYLSIIGFFAIFSTTVSKNPVLSLYVHALGGNDFIIGLIAAFSPLAGILFSFPVGSMSDKIGRKKLLIVSGIIFLIAPLLYLMVSSPYWLIPIRFFHGLATAILGPVVSAMIVEKYSKNKGEKLGIYSSSTLIGRTLAPLIGGFIISFFSVNNLLNYKLVYVSAFIVAIPVLILTFFIKEPKRTNNNKITFSDFYTSLAYFFSNKKIFVTALVEMSIYFAFGAFETFLPVYLTSLNIPSYQIGILFSAQILAIAVSNPLFGRLADKINKKIQIVLGLIVTGIAIGIIGFFSSFISILIIGIIFGLGISFSTIAISAYVADITDKNMLGTTLGGLSSIMDVGHTTGPLVTGIIIGYFSYAIGFLFALILAIIIGIIFIITTRE